MALIKEYFSLTEKYIAEYGEKTIVLMQVGAFFEVYGLRHTSGELRGSDIINFSRICDLNIADKKQCVGKEGVVMAGFSHYMIDKYLKKLQESGYTIIVFTQDEQAKNTTRSLAGIYSPGTYFSPDVEHITNNIGCIWINMVEMSQKSVLRRIENISGNSSNNRLIQIGIANIDIYTGKSHISQYHGTYTKNPTTYDDLERYISVYNPSEVIIIGNLSPSEMNDVISYSGIQCKTIHRVFVGGDADESTTMTKHACNCEKQSYQKEILERFFSAHEYSQLEDCFYENGVATQSFCFLLDFVYQHNPSLVKKISEPCFEKNTNRLQLANHSLKQLNIIDDHKTDGKYSSVLKMLNNCITPMGKRQFSYDFVNPTTDCQFLNNEYKMTDHLLTVGENMGKEVEINFANIKDTAKLVRQFFLKRVTPKSLHHLFQDVISVNHIADLCKTDQVLLTYIMNKTGNSAMRVDDVCKEMKTFLEERLDFTLCKNIDTYQNFDVNFLCKGLDADLDSKTQELAETNDKIEAIRKYINQTITSHEGKKEYTEYVKTYETEKSIFSIIGTKRRCKTIKAYFTDNPINIILEYKSSYNKKKCEYDLELNSKNLEVYAQNSANDAITTPEIRGLCKKITFLKTELKELTTSVYNTNVIESFQNKIDKFDILIDFITTIDIIFTKMNIAAKYHYCKPEIVEDVSKSFIDATGLRHCLIERLQQDEIYVTNDITLGKEERNYNQDGVLLYGTNAVGKTSFIRAIGIAVVMAQAGLYVPCNTFRYFPYTCIFTRILGNDNLFKGLSTFAVEMSELRTILRMADENSLILGDELCSGTESISAKSIFVAGVHQLCTKKCSFVFATHLHEIVNYDEIKNMDTLSLKHMEVIYDREKDELTYDRKIKDGPGTNMYGLEVCRALNLPNDFLDLANELRMKYHTDSSSMLSLESSRYNTKKLRSICEICKQMPATEIHHLQHQKHANDNGLIINKVDGSVFHKNNIANLSSICEDCHQKIHISNKQHKKVKTGNGMVIQVLCD